MRIFEVKNHIFAKFLFQYLKNRDLQPIVPEPFLKDFSSSHSLPYGLYKSSYNLSHSLAPCSLCSFNFILRINLCFRSFQYSLQFFTLFSIVKPIFRCLFDWINSEKNLISISMFQFPEKNLLLDRFKVLINFVSECGFLIDLSDHK